MTNHHNHGAAADRIIAEDAVRFHMPDNWETQSSGVLLDLRNQAVADDDWWAVDDIDIELHTRDWS